MNPLISISLARRKNDKRDRPSEWNCERLGLKLNAEIPDDWNGKSQEKPSNK